MIRTRCAGLVGAMIPARLCGCRMACAPSGRGVRS